MVPWSGKSPSCSLTMWIDFCNRTSQATRGSVQRCRDVRSHKPIVAASHTIFLMPPMRGGEIQSRTDISGYLDGLCCAHFICPRGDCVCAFVRSQQLSKHGLIAITAGTARSLFEYCCRLWASNGYFRSRISGCVGFLIRIRRTQRRWV